MPYSPDLLPTDYHFFKHLDNFLQGKCFHNQQKAENAFQELVEYWSMYYYTVGTDWFVGKNVLIVMVSSWLIKMCMFSSTYQPSGGEFRQKYSIQHYKERIRFVQK